MCIWCVYSFFIDSNDFADIHIWIKLHPHLQPHLNMYPVEKAVSFLKTSPCYSYFSVYIPFCKYRRAFSSFQREQKKGLCRREFVNKIILVPLYWRFRNQVFLSLISLRLNISVLSFCPLEVFHPVTICIKK
jgi:hypothetical protein